MRHISVAPIPVALLPNLVPEPPLGRGLVAPACFPPSGRASTRGARLAVSLPAITSPAHEARGAAHAAREESLGRLDHRHHGRRCRRGQILRCFLAGTSSDHRRCPPRPGIAFPGSHLRCPTQDLRAAPLRQAPNAVALVARSGARQQLFAKITRFSGAADTTDPPEEPFVLAGREVVEPILPKVFTLLNLPPFALFAFASYAVRHLIHSVSPCAESWLAFFMLLPLSSLYWYVVGGWAVARAKRGLP